MPKGGLNSGPKPMKHGKQSRKAQNGTVVKHYGRDRGMGLQRG